MASPDVRNRPSMGCRSRPTPGSSPFSAARCSSRRIGAHRSAARWIGYDGETMTIHETFRAKHPKSAALAERARAAIPGGITHDIRHLKPFGVYVDRAAGTRKWDVDGNEYIDYWMGHGALFLGHCHPTVVKAVQAQMARGRHRGACHELEVRWAELVTHLIPCAELVRFTMSGTEATHLAMRVARAYTGRSKIVKFTGHFHGWHDGAVAGVNPPYEVPMSAGVPGSILDQVAICPSNDIKAVQIALERGDVAAVILEPAGGPAGTAPAVQREPALRRRGDRDARAVRGRGASGAGEQGGRGAATRNHRGDEARGRPRHRLRRGVDLPRLVRGQTGPRRAGPAAALEPLSPAALRAHEQRCRFLDEPRLDLGDRHR